MLGLVEEDGQHGTGVGVRSGRNSPLQRGRVLSKWERALDAVRLLKGFSGV